MTNKLPAGAADGKFACKAGKIVVITSGIGEATAEAFARAGAHLVLAARDGTATEAVADH